MLYKKPLEKRRNAIRISFASFGFMGVNSFYNVCKSIDVTLNGFDLIAFWRLGLVNDALLTRIENVIIVLKHE